MGLLRLVVTEEFETQDCGKCGIIFAVPREWREKRISGSAGTREFYCPNGHCRTFIGETEEERLKRELAASQKAKNDALSQMWQAQSAQHVAERRVKKLESRAKAGVCPCCNRTVSQMARHMKSKHPDFIGEARKETL